MPKHCEYVELSRSYLLFSGIARSTSPTTRNLVIVEQLYGNNTTLATLHISKIECVTRDEQVWHGHMSLHSQ